MKLIHRFGNTPARLHCEVVYESGVKRSVVFEDVEAFESFFMTRWTERTVLKACPETLNVFRYLFYDADGATLSRALGWSPMTMFRLRIIAGLRLSATL